MKTLDPKMKPCVIVTPCPTEDAVLFLLDLKRRGFNLFFWIIRQRCDEIGAQTGMTGPERHRFDELGTIGLCRQPANARDRAAQLKKFIEAHKQR